MEEYDSMPRQYQQQYDALLHIADEIMDTLHAGQLRQPTIESSTVVEWLRGLYDMAEEGMGREAHFTKLNLPLMKPSPPSA